MARVFGIDEHRQAACLTLRSGYRASRGPRGLLRGQVVLRQIDPSLVLVSYLTYIRVLAAAKRCMTVDLCDRRRADAVVDHHEPVIALVAPAGCPR